MVTLDKLPSHIKTAKAKLDEAAKKAGDSKNDLTVRALKKKVKRLVRKSAKMQYVIKKAEEKKQPKKKEDA